MLFHGSLIYRAIKRAVKGFPRPLINLNKELFAQIVDQAFGQPLNPPFDPYANSLNYQLAAYITTVVGPNIYVGIIPKLQNTESKEVSDQFLKFFFTILFTYLLKECLRNLLLKKDKGKNILTLFFY